ncbi:MAG TPA: type II CAAX endopeptidase family protein [Coriobacteriia bacterium]|nr:type II CAAX endopeptidase family protein [Coriobacteriia bacterium]
MDAEPQRGGCDWTVREAWILLVVVLVAILAKDLVMASETVRLAPPDARALVTAGALFGFYAVVAVGLCVLARRRGVGVVRAFRLRGARVTLRTLLASVALVVGLLIVVRLCALGYGALTHALGWEAPTRAVVDLPGIFGPTAWGLLASIALVVLVAPVIEEIVFRGVLQEALAAEWNWRVAVCVSAAVFALYHTAPWLFVPVFALGVACGWLAHTRQTLLPAISLHAAYNVLPVALAFGVFL